MRASIGIAGACLALSLAAGVAIAQQQQGPNLADGGKKEPNEAVRLLDTSARLLDYGRKNKEPIALILAAQMRQRVALSAVERKVETEGGGKDEGPKTESAEITVDSILDEARKMSRGDKVIAQMADDVKAAATKGRVSGPAFHKATVNAGATNWYRNVAFRGGRYAEVAAVGDGDTDLDLYVYDGNGNLICSDTDLSDRTYCGWTPRWTGDFTIKLVNRGRVFNRYTLVTN
jgi:hypothetical protein